VPATAKEARGTYTLVFLVMRGGRFPVHAIARKGPCPMSTRPMNPRPAVERRRPWWGPLALMALVLVQSGCWHSRPARPSRPMSSAIST
jgi:hypothetical protein